MYPVLGKANIITAWPQNSLPFSVSSVRWYFLICLCLIKHQQKKNCSVFQWHPREILNCGCPSVLLSQGCLVLRTFDPGLSSDTARRGGHACVAFRPSVPPGTLQALWIQRVWAWEGVCQRALCPRGCLKGTTVFHFVFSEWLRVHELEHI